MVSALNARNHLIYIAYLSIGLFDWNDRIKRIPETFGVCRLPPVVKLFKSRFPKVRLSFTTCTHEGLAKDLRKGVTDLAFLMTESIQDADLELETLFTYFQECQG